MSLYSPSSYFNFNSSNSYIFLFNTSSSKSYSVVISTYTNI